MGRKYMPPQIVKNPRETLFFPWIFLLFCCQIIVQYLEEGCGRNLHTAKKRRHTDCFRFFDTKIVNLICIFSIRDSNSVTRYPIGRGGLQNEISNVQYLFFGGNCCSRFPYHSHFSFPWTPLYLLSSINARRKNHLLFCSGFSIFWKIFVRKLLSYFAIKKSKVIIFCNIFSIFSFYFRNRI